MVVGGNNSLCYVMSVTLEVTTLCALALIEAGDGVRRAIYAPHLENGKRTILFTALGTILAVVSCIGRGRA